MQRVLVNFTCGCGYHEPIGVDPSCGIILEGVVTIICPKCGAILRTENVRSILPVRILRDRNDGSQSTERQ